MTQDPKGISGQKSHLGVELDHLYRFAGTVGSNLDVDILLDDARGQLLEMAEAEKVIIVRVDHQREGLRINQLGWPDPMDVEFDRQCIEELGADTYCGIGANDFPKRLTSSFDDLDQPWALVPLLAYGRQLGFIFFVRERDSFDASTLKLLNTAGRQLAIAAENSRLFGDVQNSYRRLMEAQEGLIRSERLAALGGLAATMAHEIRNPLTTILSSLSQIRKHANISGDTATLLDIAEEESLRLNTMVGGLLEFAKPKMPRIGETQLVGVVDEVFRVARSDGSFPDGVSLNLKIDNKECVARVDPNLFGQAVSLLISNSIAAVSPKDGRIQVEIQSAGLGDADLDVVVVDNGCGIEPELQHSVFEPFFTTNPSGTGLGLSVVKRIVEDHGGSLKMDSTPGNGTRIRMRFNRALAPAE